MEHECDSGCESRPNPVYPVICLQGGGVTSQHGNGFGYSEDVCFTLNAFDVHGVAYEIHQP